MLFRVQHGQEPAPLPAALQAQIEAWAVEGAEPPLPVSQLLASLHRVAALACDCRGAGDQPTACVVRLPRGDLILRWYNGIAHAATCPLQRQTEDRPPSEAPRGRSPSYNRPWSDGWDLLGPAVARARGPGEGQPVERAPSADAAPRMPRLGRVLLSALARCGYAQLGVADLDPKDPTQPRDPKRWAHKLYRLLSEPVNDQLTFQQTSALGLEFLAAWLGSRLPQSLPRFASLRPQGVLIGLADHIEPRGRGARLVGFDGDPDREALLDVPVRRFGPAATGPWWVILQAAQVVGTSRFSVIDAYAHPAFSRALPVPVDSGAERQLLEVVLGQISFWKRYPKTNAFVTLVKPVHDIATDHGPCRPDLLLSFQDTQRRRHALVLECMGLDDPEYQDRKLRTHAAMRSLPDVHGLFEFHPGAVPIENLRRQLTAALFAGARHAPHEIPQP